MPRRNVTRLLFTFFNFSGFGIFLCFFARVVFIAKILFFDVFQLGASFLFFDDGEICLATPDPGSCLWIECFESGIAELRLTTWIKSHEMATFRNLLKSRMDLDFEWRNLGKMSHWKEHFEPEPDKDLESRKERFGFLVLKWNHCTFGNSDRQFWFCWMIALRRQVKLWDLKKVSFQSKSSGTPYTHCLFRSDMLPNLYVCRHWTNQNVPDIFTNLLLGVTPHSCLQHPHFYCCKILSMTNK